MADTAGSEKKGTKRPSKILLGRWERNTVLGELIFVVEAEVKGAKKERKEAVLKLFSSGAELKGLTALTVSSEKPISVRESVSVLVTM